MICSTTIYQPKIIYSNHPLATNCSHEILLPAGLSLHSAKLMSLVSFSTSRSGLEDHLPYICFLISLLTNLYNHVTVSILPLPQAMCSYPLMFVFPDHPLSADNKPYPKQPNVIFSFLVYFPIKSLLKLYPNNRQSISVKILCSWYESE